MGLNPAMLAQPGTSIQTPVQVALKNMQVGRIGVRLGMLWAWWVSISNKSDVSHVVNLFAEDVDVY